MAGSDGGSPKAALPGVGRAGMPLGLVALAALLYSLSPGGATRPPAAADDKKATAEAAEPVRDPLQPLYEFLDVQNGTGKSPGPCIGFRQYEIEFIIATVPDPIDSHLAPSFDRAVDAIQRGLQSTRRTLDRYWLPWKRDAESRWQLTFQDSSPTVAAKSAPSVIHREVPGTLLFRDPEDPTKVLVVLLVGEVPTWGVQRQALRTALEAIQKTERYDTKHPCLFPARRSIRVLGPYFSGSTESLRNGLVAWNRERATETKIISGSATVDGNAEKMRAACIDFSATVIPDGPLTRQFNEFLKTLNATPQDVAIFVEGGTSYGSANPNFNGPKATTASAYEEEHLCRDDSAASAKPAAPVTVPVQRPRFTVDFPLHVAQLRAAYEKDEALRVASAQARGPRHSLELALESDDHASTDIVHPQDGVATAGSSDLTLGDSIETIRREKIRFVGIIASDPRDVLFIARKVREAGSDATLFTYGADILFTHPDYVRYLRGMLVVTPYPLFPGNQALTRTGWRRVSFAGSSEEGIYNAMRWFGGRKARLLDYRAPDLDRSNDGPSRPPIWITVVGRESFWPVSITTGYWEGDDPVALLAERYVLESDRIETSDAQSERSYAGGPPPVPHPPGSAVAAVLVESLIGLFAASYWIARRSEPDLATRNELKRFKTSLIRKRLPEYALRYFTIWNGSDAKRINGAYVFALLLIGTAAQAGITITLIWTRRLLGEPIFGPLLLGFGLLLLVILLAALLREAIALAMDSFVARGWRLAIAIGWALLAAATSIVVLAALLRYLGFLKSASPARLLVFYSRAFDLTSAVSPVLPLGLFALVLALWSFCNLDRAFFIEVRGAASEVLDGATMTGFGEAQKRVTRVLSDSVTRLGFLLAPLLVFVPFYRVFFGQLDSIDGSAWGVVLKALALGAYGVVAYSLSLFLSLWVRLRQFLQRLSRHPLAPAFQRLPPALATSPWKMWRAVPSLTTLQASVAQLRLLVNLRPKSPAQFWLVRPPDEAAASDTFWTHVAEQADQAEVELDNVFNHVNPGFIVTLSLQKRVKEKLQAATTMILAQLQSAWKEWPPPLDPSKDRSKDAAKTPSMDTDSWLRLETPGPTQIWVHAAEEFLAIRISVFIRYVFIQMKNLLSFSLAGFVLGVVALASYPFQPRRPMMALVWIVGILSISAVGIVIVSIDRDRILSYIGKTPAGEVSLNHEFVTTLTLYVVVPLLTLLATQFPGIGDFVYSVFTPAIKSGK